MFKKKFMLILVLILVTGLCATVLASETTSNWSPSYGGANFQYVKPCGFQVAPQYSPLRIVIFVMANIAI